MSKIPPLELYSTTDAGYFRAMGIPLIAGRTFDQIERQRGDEAIIDQEAAKTFFHDSTGRSAIGKRFRRFAEWAVAHDRRCRWVGARHVAGRAADANGLFPRVRSGRHARQSGVAHDGDRRADERRRRVDDAGDAGIDSRTRSNAARPSTFDRCVERSTRRSLGSRSR